MRKPLKATRYISGLTLLASILLFIDYYLPKQDMVLVIDKTSFNKETWVDRRGIETNTYFTYAHAGKITISSNNFRCISGVPPDTMLLTRSAIYKFQTHITGLSGFDKGVGCEAEFSPFVLKGIFVLIPVIFSILALRAKELGGAIILCAVSAGLYLSCISPLFML